MDEGGLGTIWTALQPDWPMVVLLVTVGLLLVVLLGFLTAALVLRRNNGKKAERWRGYEREWGELLEAVAAGVASGADLRETIEAGEELHFVDFLYKQAVATDDPERRALLRRLAMPYLPQIEVRTRGGDAERRARAVKTLSELGGESHVQTMVTALDDPSPLVSMSAARALALHPRTRTVHELVSRVDRFSDWNARFLRATLRRLGPAAVPPLRETVRNAAHSPRVRAVAVEVLGELGDEEAPRLAGELLEEGDEVDVMAASLRVIGRSGDRAQIQRVRSLCWHEDPVIRAQAIAALSRIAYDSDYELLEGALDDASAWVTLHAARGLKRGDRVAALEKWAADEEGGDPANRAVAIQVLREEA